MWVNVLTCCIIYICCVWSVHCSQCYDRIYIYILCKMIKDCDNYIQDFYCIQDFNYIVNPKLLRVTGSIVSIQDTVHYKYYCDCKTVLWYYCFIGITTEYGNDHVMWLAFSLTIILIKMWSNRSCDAVNISLHAHQNCPVHTCPFTYGCALHHVSVACIFSVIIM